MTNLFGAQKNSTRKLIKTSSGLEYENMNSYASLHNAPAYKKITISRISFPALDSHSK
ncbi:MAG: hypothetical protein ABIA63_03500 [bacterium]